MLEYDRGVYLKEILDSHEFLTNAELCLLSLQIFSLFPFLCSHAYYLFPSLEYWEIKIDLNEELETIN